LCDSEEIVENPISGASGDVGDLSFLIPTIQFGFSGIKGRFHDDFFEVSDNENCYITSAKVMLGTIYDLLTEKSSRVYTEDYKGRKIQYLENIRTKG